MKKTRILLSLLLLGLLSVAGYGQTVGTAVRHYTSPEIDGSTTGTITLGTTVTDGTVVRNFHPFAVSVTLTDVDNVLTPAVFSVGTNSAPYNNIVASTATGGILAKIKLLNLSSDLEEISEATDIKVKIGTACTALFGSPTCKFKVTVIGIEQVYANP